MLKFNLAVNKCKFPTNFVHSGKVHKQSLPEHFFKASLVLFSVNFYKKVRENDCADFVVKQFIVPNSFQFEKPVIFISQCKIYKNTFSEH